MERMKTDKNVVASAAGPVFAAEKKVEYLELIYDLIFVYIIGRNNSLLQSLGNGFVPWRTFAAYVLFTLAVIQIWNFSTFYINMFGRNGVRDHIFLFVNMYLLYYIGEGTRLHWENFHTQYHIAWALILINIGLQYLIEIRNHSTQPEIMKTIRGMMVVLFGEAALVLFAIPTSEWPFPVFSLLAVLFGICMAWLFADEKKAHLVDFTHLSERAMLYVVFTFGEMIIAIASYFEGSLSFGSVYFSAMAFLIVTALFLGYEILYNYIIDRDRTTTGMFYMLTHVFLIFAMNNLTIALEFMRDERVALVPKTWFLTGSFLLYYVCLFTLMRYAKKGKGLCPRFVVPLMVLGGVFVALMILLQGYMRVNIFVSVMFVYAMFMRIYVFGKKVGQ